MRRAGESEPSWISISILEFTDGIEAVRSITQPLTPYPGCHAAPRYASRLPISSSAPAIPLRMICNASGSDLNPPLQMCRTFLRPSCISMPVCRGNTDISNNKSRSSFQLNSQALHVKAPNSSSVQYDRSTIIVLHDQNLLFICGFRQMHLLDGSAFRQVKFRLICVALSLALC